MIPREIYLLSVFLHIVSASFWLGGILYLSLVALPLLRKEGDLKSFAHRFYSFAVRHQIFGGIALAILLITGIVNLLYRGIPLSTLFFLTSPKGVERFIVEKFYLFFLLVAIQHLHDFVIGRRALRKMMAGEDPGVYRTFSILFGQISLLLTFFIVYLAIRFVRG